MADPGYGWAEHGKPRRDWKRRLKQYGPVVCGYQGCEVCNTPPCGRLVYDDPALNWDGKVWHLGHRLAIKHGGTNGPKSPEHGTCNDRDAACLTNHANPAPVTHYAW